MICSFLLLQYANFSVKVVSLFFKKQSIVSLSNILNAGGFIKILLFYIYSGFLVFLPQ